MNLAEITLKIDELNEKRKAEDYSHKQIMASLDADIKKLRVDRNSVASGLDLDKIHIAKQVLRIRGKYLSGSPQRYNSVHRAISDIAAGCKGLKYEYFGVKDYAHFGDQECDCRYGMVPTHGSIVFSVGLEVRDRELTTEEIDAAIYLLLNIEQAQKSEQVAA